MRGKMPGGFSAVQLTQSQWLPIGNITISSLVE
jgi:hypothetical protein